MFMILRLLPLALLFLLACLAPRLLTAPARAEEAGPGFAKPASRPAAPAWTLKTPEGKPLSLADYKGKIVVLNFWATWCPPCRAELPGFGATQKAYAAKGVQFLGLSIDALQGDVQEIAPLLKNAGVAYPVALATEKTLADYGATEGVPITYFIDRKGKIAGRQVGGMEEDDLKGCLDALLKEKPATQ